MIGEVAIGGVFVPTLLAIGGAALLLCALLSGLLSAVGLYRLIVLRPLVDLSLFVLLYAVIAQIGGSSGSLS